MLENLLQIERIEKILRLHEEIAAIQEARIKDLKELVALQDTVIEGLKSLISERT